MLKLRRMCVSVCVWAVRITVWCVGVRFYDYTRYIHGWMWTFNFNACTMWLWLILGCIGPNKQHLATTPNHSRSVAMRDVCHTRASPANEIRNERKSQTSDCVYLFNIWMRYSCEVPCLRRCALTTCQHCHRMARSNKWINTRSFK